MGNSSIEGENNMSHFYKVGFINPYIGKENIGNSVLCEKFDKFDTALNAALERLIFFSHAIVEIRRYADEDTNIIDFNSNDSGITVYRYAYEGTTSNKANFIL